MNKYHCVGIAFAFPTCCLYIHFFSFKLKSLPIFVFRKIVLLMTVERDVFALIKVRDDKGRMSPVCFLPTRACSKLNEE